MSQAGGWGHFLYRRSLLKLPVPPCLVQRSLGSRHFPFLASRFYFFISSPATLCIVTLYAAVPNLTVPGWAGVVLPCLQIDETPSVQSAGLSDESAKPSQSPPSSGFELHLFAIDLATLVLCSSCAATLLCPGGVSVGWASCLAVHLPNPPQLRPRAPLMQLAVSNVHRLVASWVH